MDRKPKEVKLIDEIVATAGCEAVRKCIQCGTCTASCPNADRMDHTPSQLIAMARANMRNEVLSSNAPWFCLSCYMCTVRCPRGIQATVLMHTLEELAIRNKLANRQTLTPVMYRTFNHYCNTGNLSELQFMMRYYFSTNPFRALPMIPVALNLLKRGRLSFKSRKLSPAGQKQLRDILQKAESLGGVA
jgi:heterodisulfide reductase subunit C